MNSLFKRVTLPLLVVTAACTLTAFLPAPTRAATASFDYCQGVYMGTTNQGVAERVKCTMSGESFWKKVENHANLIGGGDDHYAENTPNVWGPGDRYYPSAPNATYLGHTVSGTYNCWAICYFDSLVGEIPASTGGGDKVTF